jgi:CHAT domain/FHA domain
MVQPTWKPYKDFVIEIRSGDKKGRYEVRARGATGEAHAQFKVPLKAEHFEQLLDSLRRSSSTINAGGQIPEPVQASIDVGQKLYDALFTGEVRDVYQTALYEASEAKMGLRVQLRIKDVPQLADLPWEFLYNGKNFLVLSSDTPLVYYLDLPETPRPLTITPPLRMLVTVSGPVNLQFLDVDAEKDKLMTALKPLIDRRVVQVDFAPDASLATLQDQLRRGRGAGQPYHVWHFIGHGAFDDQEAEGTSVLMFTDENGQGVAVGGFQLGTMFNSYPDVRLAVLNACQGARTSAHDPFNGVATRLVQNGIPAVIGMQFEISDRAAITFSSQFYEALVDGLPIDAALGEARRAIFFTPNWVEWATPVLFMRVADGTLFVFPDKQHGVSTAEVPVLKPPPTPADTPAYIEKADSGDSDTLSVDYTNKITYQPYPRRPGPDDKDLLPTPWFVILKVHLPDTSPVIGLHLYGDTRLGRDSQTSAGDPMISLAAYGGLEQGVSREHAIFQPTRDGLFIVDNHSTNGLTINGVPAVPGVPTAINHMDKLRIAKLRIDIYIVDRPVK